MSKLKVTLSLDRTLIGAVDEAVKCELADSRSAAVEEAIRIWRLEQRRQQIEQEVVAYYRSLTAAERREDRSWARAGVQHAKRRWEA